MLHEITISGKEKEELIDITADVASIVKRINNGIAVVFVKHTSAGILINEADKRLTEDILETLVNIVPKKKYKHPDNAIAHIKASLLGSSVTVPVKDGKMELGKWQSIFFAEFDGPRNRTVLVKLVGE